jgi:hypothetical protein
MLFSICVSVVVAERVGFEPTVELPRQQFSRLPDSAALAPLRFYVTEAPAGYVCGWLEQALGENSVSQKYFQLVFFPRHVSVP